MQLNEFFLRRRSLFLGSFALLISTSLGCGGKGQVTGQVTLDGNPLPAGRIAFIPSKGAAVGGDIKDGQYSVSGVPAGEVKVTVETKALLDEINALTTNVQHASAMQPPAGANVPDNAKADLEAEKQEMEKKKQRLAELKKAYRPVPDKYGKPDTSGLSLPVKSGPNTFEVKLTSK